MAVDPTVAVALAALGGAIASPLIGKLVPARKPSANREHDIDKRIDGFIERVSLSLAECERTNTRLAQRVADLERELGKVRVELEQWKAGIRRRSGEDEM